MALNGRERVSKLAAVSVGESDEDFNVQDNDDRLQQLAMEASRVRVTRLLRYSEKCLPAVAS